MYFFINNALNVQNSGIEHAQLQRAKVFDQYELDYKLLYMGFNPQFELSLKRFQLKRDRIINLFDYYQRTLDVPTKVVLPTDIFLSDLEVEYQKDVNNTDCYLVLEHNNLMGRIHYRLDDQKRKRVTMVERFDIYGNLYRVDEYDLRGFVTRSQLYTPDNKIYAFIWFDIDGKPVVTETFTENRDHKYITNTFELVDRFGAHNYYRTYRDMVLKFLNDLNAEYFSKERPNYFVGDRMENYEDVLTHLDQPAIKIAHLHNSHGGDVHDEMHSLLNNYYEFDLYNNDNYDFYIAATHKQTNDVKARFGLGDRVKTIPVGLTKPLSKVKVSDRKPHSVLVTARRAEEKQIEKIIAAVGKAKAKISDITLDVYGYRDGRNNDAAKKKIDAAIKKYDLADCVTINDYDPDLDKQRDQHEVYMVFSTMEGFNIALMEAQSHGEIGVVNDVNYGPNELVVDDQNGYVVGYDDVDGAAEKLVQIFSDDQLAQRLSDGAYALSNRYYAKAIYDAWMELSHQATEQWLKLPKRLFSDQGLEEISDVDQYLKDQHQKRLDQEKELFDKQQKDVLAEIEAYKAKKADDQKKKSAKTKTEAK